MAYALTCACGYVRRLLVVSLRPLSLPTRKLEAQGGRGAPRETRPTGRCLWGCRRSTSSRAPRRPPTRQRARRNGHAPRCGARWSGRSTPGSRRGMRPCRSRWPGPCRSRGAASGGRAGRASSRGTSWRAGGLKRRARGTSFVQWARLTRYVGILKTWATSFVLRVLGLRDAECTMRNAGVRAWRGPRREGRPPRRRGGGRACAPRGRRGSPR